MSRCLSLAIQGLGSVKSNPLVGCVIVENNEIIGEGYHAYFGGPHAEVMAIQSVQDQNRLKNATLYVNLEPCHHHGKTPPCSLLITEKKIPHVVIGQRDPFDKVDGKGIHFLSSSGVKVEYGILEEECRSLNKRFNTFHEKKRPYVLLKWAQSEDGFIDILRSTVERKSHPISCSESQMLTHQWRSEEMGILVGRTTVERDNPRLNVRLSKGDSPIRMVIDPHLKLLELPNSHFLDGTQPTLYFHTIDNACEPFSDIAFIQIRLNAIWEDVFFHLHKRNITSVMIEGGCKTIQSLIDQSLWDEARVFVSRQHLQTGISAPCLPLHPDMKQTSGTDNLFYYFRK